MNRDYIIVADSTNDLPVEYTTDNNVEIVNLLYEIDGITYGKEKELSVILQEAP